MGWWRKKKVVMGWLRKKKKKPNFKIGAMLLEELIECCDGKSNPINFFSADEIRKATDNFNVSNDVSELYHRKDFDFYKWYSSKNKNHHMMLIKKPIHHNFLEKEVVDLQGLVSRDIAISSMVSGHKNFLKLIGCCLEFRPPAMVYHGVKKHYGLDGNLREQPWKRRMKIAEDIATALAYLHTAFPRPFVYRTLFLENIILDEDGVAKLSEFSFCLSIPIGEAFVDNVVPVYDEMAKEVKYVKDGVVSKETDVHDIGMLMLTLLTGEERFLEVLFRREVANWRSKLRENIGEDDDFATMFERKYPGEHIPNWLSKFMKEPRMDEIADREILEKMGEISEEEELSLRCIGFRGEVPTMVEVAKELKKIQRTLKNDEDSSLSGETQFDSAQDTSFSVLPLKPDYKHKGIAIACQVFEEMFQWVILSWFRLFRKNRRMC